VLLTLAQLLPIARQSGALQSGFDKSNNGLRRIL
jgi:hypothetical protein